MKTNTITRSVSCGILAITLSSPAHAATPVSLNYDFTTNTKPTTVVGDISGSAATFEIGSYSASLDSISVLGSDSASTTITAAFGADEYVSFTLTAGAEAVTLGTLIFDRFIFNSYAAADFRSILLPSIR